MLIVFAVGIERIEVYGGCVFVSILIHYFSLVSVMWMGAEALLMFQKLVMVFMRITTNFIIILSLVCWRKFSCTCTMHAIQPTFISLEMQTLIRKSTISVHTVGPHYNRLCTIMQIC